MSANPLFGRVAIVGMGLIGSSCARAIRLHALAGHLVACDRSEQALTAVRELGLADRATADPADAVRDADLVLLCTPVGSYAELARQIASHLKPGAILSDVGSVKQVMTRDVLPHIPHDVHLIPGHPVAGTEYSGPHAGFAALFDGRWTILTPPPGSDPAAVAKLRALWEAVGSKVAEMSADHHDRVLAITSHLPHLIAYTIVGTATDLEEHMQAEVIKYSAGGFRDFTRIAASDPIMWRDVFLNNRDAVLEMLGRLYEDLAILQRAIRIGDGQTLEELFTRTRAIRRGIVEAQQA